MPKPGEGGLHRVSDLRLERLKLLAEKLDQDDADDLWALIDDAQASATPKAPPPAGQQVVNEATFSVGVDESQRRVVVSLSLERELAGEKQSIEAAFFHTAEEAARLATLLVECGKKVQGNKPRKPRLPKRP